MGKLFTFSPDSTLKKLRSPLCEPVTTVVASGLNLAFQASTGLAVMEFTSDPFSRSQILMLESTEVETRPKEELDRLHHKESLYSDLRVPSTETSTEITPIECPSKVYFNSPELPSLLFVQYYALEIFDLKAPHVYLPAFNCVVFRGRNN